jgi:hypothetical protein
MLFFVVFVNLPLLGTSIYSQYGANSDVFEELKGISTVKSRFLHTCLNITKLHSLTFYYLNKKILFPFSDESLS